MKFANKYKLIAASDQRAQSQHAPLLPEETGLRNYERAASALAGNIRDRSIPPNVALENDAFLRDKYMEALNRVMSDRNQIVDRLDSIARLISLNSPAGGIPAPLAGIRDVRDPEEPVKHEPTPPPFEERAERTPRQRRRQLPAAPPRRLGFDETPATGRRHPKTKTPPGAEPTRDYLKQDKTKLSPLVLRRAGIKGWVPKKK